MNAGAKRYLLATLAVLSLLLVTQPASRADTITVNTTSLQGNPSGPFVLGFVFLDASISGDGNNTAILSNFNFGGGSAGAVLTSGGGVTGNLQSGITLTDSDPSEFNFITSAFTPGTTLSFNLAITANPDLTLNPASGLSGDQFLFVILDSTGKRISTNDNISDTLATATISPAGVSVQQFSIPASTSVPEPATLLLLGSGLVFGILRKRR
jgi:PEP-CTERM motif